MKTIQANVIIHQPIDQVVEFAWDSQNTQLWIPEPSQSIPLATEPGQSVTCFRKQVRGWAGITLVLDLEIRVLVPNRRLEERMRELHGRFVSRGVWDYQPVVEGTRVSVEHDVELRGWLRLLDPLIFWLAQKKVEGDLLRLKAHLEQG